ncbi:MAG: hypothetical protein KJZ57_10430, partial [Anaerolineales bacterium]|nr:hypothetical protein [Anaerolineales bacterium]
QQPEQPTITPEKAARAAARAEVEKAFGPSRPEVQQRAASSDPLAVWRDKVERAEAAGDGPGLANARGQLTHAEKLVSEGENPRHHGTAIQAAGHAAEGAYYQQKQGMTDAEAKREAARRELFGNQETPAKEPQQQQLTAKEKARAEVEKALGRSGRSRGGGVEL